MDWNIRAATMADYDALCSLFAQVDRLHYTALPGIFRPTPGPARERAQVEEIINDRLACLFVACWGSAVIGMAQAAIRDTARWPLSVSRRWVYVNDIVVDERFRGKGIGKELLARVESWAREQGVMRVELTVWEFNTSARSLYERQGFRTLNRTMRKDLDE